MTWMIVFQSDEPGWNQWTHALSGGVRVVAAASAVTVGRPVGNPISSGGQRSGSVTGRYEWFPDGRRDPRVFGRGRRTPAVTVGRYELDRSGRDDGRAVCRKPHIVGRHRRAESSSGPFDGIRETVRYELDAVLGRGFPLTFNVDGALTNTAVPRSAVSKSRPESTGPLASF